MGREITLGLFAIVLGALGAFMVSRLGCRLGLVDQPTARSSHSHETPKGGGIGMAAAFLVPVSFSQLPATPGPSAVVRLSEGIRLYRKIKVNERSCTIILTGGRYYGNQYAASAVSREWLISLGIPANDCTPVGTFLEFILDKSDQ